MPRTIDRFPGEREDEGVVLLDQGPGGLAGGDPTVVGGIRHVSGRVRLLDALGVFNARAVYIADVDPSPNEDAASGYGRGMWWLNEVTGALFICVTDSVADASWLPLSTFVATQAGQTLMSLDSVSFSPVSPTVGVDGWLADEEEELLYD